MSSSVGCRNHGSDPYRLNGSRLSLPEWTELDGMLLPWDGEEKPGCERILVGVVRGAGEENGEMFDTGLADCITCLPNARGPCSMPRSVDVEGVWMGP